jgi:predicted nucleotide-binding protein (sugar kinase/HSP70/actin superfamily)
MTSNTDTVEKLRHELLTQKIENLSASNEKEFQRIWKSYEELKEFIQKKIEDKLEELEADRNKRQGAMYIIFGIFNILSAVAVALVIDWMTNK